MQKYKIVFWSEKSDSGTTCNMYAVAAVLALKYHYKMTAEKQGKIFLSDGKIMLTIVDCGAGMGLYAKKQLESADLIAVNFRQVPHMLDFLFTDYAGISDRLVYFISSYHKDSIYHKKYIYRYYRITPERLGVIPYNPEFQMACSRGRAAAYVRGKDSLDTTDRREYFFEELERAVEMLLRNLDNTSTVEDKGRILL